MYCNYCGKQIPDDSNLCAYCGAGVAGGAVRAPVYVRRRLVRPIEGRKIGGVAIGMAQYFGEDVSLMRLLWFIAVLLTLPLGILAYIVAWIIIPEEPLQLPAAQQPAATQAKP